MAEGKASCIAIAMYAHVAVTLSSRIHEYRMGAIQYTNRRGNERGGPERVTLFRGGSAASALSRVPLFKGGGVARLSAARAVRAPLSVVRRRRAVKSLDAAPPYVARF